MNLTRSRRIKSYLIFIFLSGLFLTEARTQEVIIGQADSLYQVGDYYAASVAYEYFIFKSPNHEGYKQAKYRKSLCFKEIGEYQRALHELSEIGLIRGDERFRDKVLYQKALNSYLLQEYPQAQLNLSRINVNQCTDSLKEQLLSLKALTHNQLRQFDEARTTLQLLVQTMKLEKEKENYFIEVIDSLYMHKRLPKYFKEDRAKHLSQFIPGAGQAYTGHIGEGAVSFLLNAALLGFGIHQLYYGYYFTAYIGGLAIFYKTYMGGMQRAVFLAHAENKNRMTSFNEKNLELLSSIVSERNSSSNQ